MKKFDGTPKDLKSKETLARLLAAEGVTVRYGCYNTASFDLTTRVLRKPVFSSSSEEVDDLFTLHEVGHSLWTPPEGWHSAMDVQKLPHRLLNILEDVRIERLMKAKYPGAARTMHIGYKHLSSRGFFGDMSKIRNYSFMDRLNVYSKMGDMDRETTFKPSETWAVDAAFASETWQDVVDLAEKIIASRLDSSALAISFDLSMFAQQPGPDTGDINDNPEPGITDRVSKEFEDAEATANGSRNYNRLEGYLERMAPSKMIDLKEFARKVEACNSVAAQTYRSQHPRFASSEVLSYEDWSSTNYREWASMIKKEASEMASEFEAKKKAHSIAFSTVSKTGRLDVRKLHTSPIRDDVFKRKTTVKKGKSHAFTLLVDCSGSMGNSIAQVMDQAMIMLQMCSMIGVKADVYGYTSESLFAREGSVDCTLIHVGSTKDVATSLRNGFFGVRRSLPFQKEHPSIKFRFYGAISMGGTPTADAIMALEPIMRENMSQCEVCNLVVFTDGESDQIRGIKWNGSTYIDQGQQFCFPSNMNDRESIKLYDGVTGKIVYEGDNSRYKTASFKEKELSMYYGTGVAATEVSVRILRTRLMRDFNAVFYVASTTNFNNHHLYTLSKDAGMEVNSEEVPGGVRRFTTSLSPSIDSFYFIRSNRLEADITEIDMDLEEALDRLEEKKRSSKKLPDPNKSTPEQLEKKRADAARRLFSSLNEARARRRAFSKRVIQDIAGLGF